MTIYDRGNITFLIYSIMKPFICSKYRLTWLFLKNFKPLIELLNLSFSRKKKIATNEAKKYILEVNSKVTKENITKKIIIKNEIEYFLYLCLS